MELCSQVIKEQAALKENVLNEMKHENIELTKKIKKFKNVKEVWFSQSQKSESCYFTVQHMKNGRVKKLYFSLRNHHSFSETIQYNFYWYQFRTVNDLHEVILQWLKYKLSE